MKLTVALWLLVWGGMYTGLYNIQTPAFLTDPLSFFQGIRAILPVFAIYLCLMWLLKSQSRLIPPFKTPLGFLLDYCLVAIAASFFSPDILTALYWGAMYVSPLLVTWLILTRKDPIDNLRMIMYLNYILAILMMLIILPEALRIGFTRTQIYQLPFNLGIVKANGVGRFALVVVILSFVRLTTKTKRWRYLWLLLFIASLYLLIHTQSRSSLIGFAAAGMLIVYLRGINWRFLFAGPIGAYILWLSAFKWRAHGQIENLVFLTGREYTWQMGIDLIKKSPVWGWGFHADRIMLEFQHMHNSYFHTMIQSGILGSIFFLSALVGVWAIILRGKLLQKIRKMTDTDKPLLIESIAILGFLTTRSFVESTAAFYGVDLLFFVPIIAYIYLWSQKTEKGVK